MAVQPGTDAAPAETRSSALRTIATKPLAALLVLVMAVGSVLLWIGIPVGWLYVASRIQGDTTQPSLGPYIVVLFGIPLTMWVFGRLLFRLNRAYERLTGQSSEVRVQLPWHRSLRGEREYARRANVLEVTMIISVTLCLLAFGVWFFLFAGSSLPGAP